MVNLVRGTSVLCLAQFADVNMFPWSVLRAGKGNERPAPGVRKYQSLMMMAGSRVIRILEVKEIAICSGSKGYGESCEHDGKQQHEAALPHVHRCHTGLPSMHRSYWIQQRSV